MFGRMLSSIAFASLLVAAAAHSQVKHDPASGAVVTAKPSAAKSQMKFDVVSIRPARPGESWHFGFRPDGFSAGATSVQSLVYMAYFTVNMSDDNAVSGAPDWARNDFWDVEAKLAPEDVAEYQKRSTGSGDGPDSVGRQLLQSMLADRFHLIVHRVPAQMDGYALVAAKGGLKMKEAAADGPRPPGSLPMPGGGFMTPRSRGEDSHFQFYAATMSGFVTAVLRGAGVPVVDRTGLSGKYDFTLNWISSGADDQRTSGAAGNGSDILSHIDLGALGLRLERIRLPTEHIVIDHVDWPTEN